MKKLLLAILLVAFPLAGNAALNDLAGRIVLQVEENGEAWYVSPVNLDRYYLGRPDNAFSLMREKGIGIKNSDLLKIPVGLDILAGNDTDMDGLPDEFEKAIGTNYQLYDTDGDRFSDMEELKNDWDPRSNSILPISTAFSSRNRGKIFLQIESKGEAWYVYPGNNRRYFLGRPSDAFAVMKKLGLGISNADLNRLIALTPNFNLPDFEKEVHRLINIERQKNNLPALLLNDEVSRVARRHSQDLALENEAFTAMDSFCSFPLIHHEGLNFGIYHGERLANSGIKYHKMSGENIALLGSAAVTLTYEAGSVSDAEFDRCSDLQSQWDASFKAAMDNENTEDSVKLTILKAELKKREDVFEASRRLRIGGSKWMTMDELAKKTVDGWMNSPGHRKNILQAEYDEAGMGAAYVNSYVITTQVFITRTDCGYEGAACCQQKDYDVCYEPNSCVKGICQADN